MRRFESLIAVGALGAALSGCETAGQPATSTPVSPATMMGSGPPVDPGYQPTYCSSEVAQKYTTQPGAVATNAPKRQPGGGVNFSGSVNLGDQGVKQFTCRFDADGRFIDVMSLEDEGAL